MRSSNATIMYPINKRNVDRYFAKWRPVALPNVRRSPLASTTLAPIANFPSVACTSDASISAQYNHEAQIPISCPINSALPPITPITHPKTKAVTIAMMKVTIVSMIAATTRAQKPIGRASKVIVPRGGCVYSLAIATGAACRGVGFSIISSSNVNTELQYGH